MFGNKRNLSEHADYSIPRSDKSELYKIMTHSFYFFRQATTRRVFFLVRVVLIIRMKSEKLPYYMPCRHVGTALLGGALLIICPPNMPDPDLSAALFLEAAVGA